jgi:hypothetical protein
VSNETVYIKGWERIRERGGKETEVLIANGEEDK